MRLALLLVGAGVLAFGQPDPMMAERNKALQLLDLGRRQEAADIGIALVRQKPLFYPAYVIFGRLQRSPEGIRAQQTLKDLLESDRRYRPLLYGVVQLAPDGNTERSLLVRCAREAPEAWFCLAALPGGFGKVRKGDVGPSFLAKLIGRQLVNANDRLALGMTYRDMKKFGEALRELTFALENGDKNDAYRQAFVERELAFAAGSKSFAAAEEHYQKSLAIGVALEDWNWIIPISDAWATAAAIAHQNDRAAQFDEENIRFASYHRIPSWGLKPSLHLAQLHLDSGDLDRARREARDCIDSSHKLGSAGTEVECHLVYSRAASLGGDHHEALADLESTRDVASVAGPWSLGMVLRGVGHEYQFLGEYAKSLQTQLEAVRVFESGTFHDAAGAQLGNIGELYENLGDSVDALFYYRQALEMARRFHDAGEQMSRLTSVAKLKIDEGNPREGERLLRQALLLDGRAKWPPWKAWALLTLGEAYIATGRFSGATQLIEESTKTFEGAHDRESAGNAYGILGRGYLNHGDLAGARRAFDKCLEDAGDSGSVTLGIAARRGLAEVDRRQDHPEESLEHLRLAIAAIESLRANIRIRDLQSSFTQDNWKTYVEAAETLAALNDKTPGAGHDREAFAMAEQGRARAFLDTLASSETDVNRLLPAPDRKRHQELVAELNHALSAQLVHDNPESETRLRKAQLALSQWSVEVNPDANSAEHDLPRLAGIPEIQASLAPGAALLEYMLGEKQSLLWVITRDNARMLKIPSRAGIEAKVGAYRKTLTDPGAGNDIVARQLFHAVFAPGTPYLKQVRDLIIVPDGTLHYLPFEALRQPSGYLVEKYTIGYAPSASAVVSLRQVPKPERQRDLLAFGDPRFRLNSTAADQPSAMVRGIYRSKGFAFLPLPNSRSEVTAIAQLFQPDRRKTYLGPAATKAALLAEPLDSYRLLHFATHALFDEKTPEQSGIVLTSTGKEDDGILRVNDIAQMKLNADLVVLSACQTGLGKLMRGEGVEGLTRAFLSAGAQRVAVSLWKVSDIATSEFMKSFYREMQRGQTPAAALREAKVKMLHSEVAAYRDPYYWAGFVMVGVGE
jgi:CHAT domain-containing protein/tetratricopeptide (TPR) repeat protein